MLKHYAPLIDDSHVDTQYVSAEEYDALARIIDTQVQGALEGLGAGLLAGGAVTAGAGLSVNVAALQALVRASVGLVYLETAGVLGVTGLDPNATLYLYAGAIISGTYDPDDSRQTAEVIFTTQSTGGDLAGHTRLARIVTGASSITSVTDLRAWSPVAQTLNSLVALQAQVAADEGAIGAGYFGGSPPAQDLNTRVATLEAGGSGGGGTTYWGLITMQAPGVPLTIMQAIQQAVAAALASGGGSGTGTTVTAEPFWDVVGVNGLKDVLMETRYLRPSAGDKLLDTAVVVLGYWGDGSNGSDDLIDRDNTTWPL